MKIGYLTDPHITQEIQIITKDWRDSAIESFNVILDTFSKEQIDCGVVNGDFFDKALLKAKHVRMIMDILKRMDEMGIKWYFNLGNHEIEKLATVDGDDEENILELLGSFNNLIPVTKGLVLHNEGWIMIPYSENPEDYSYMMDGYIVFTHHDIYGSSLAAGRSKAKFGLDPAIFSKAARVFNGHIHSKSAFANIVNTGAFLCGAQGELSPKEHPSAYIIEWDHQTTQLTIKDIPNHHAIHYVTCDAKNYRKVMDYYKGLGCKVVLRYEYTDQADLDVFDKWIQYFPHIIRHNLRRMMDVSNVTNNAGPQVTATIDVPTILHKRVQDDPKVDANDKTRYVDVGKKLLDRGRR